MNQNVWLGLLPLFFIGMWFAVTTLLTYFSGWIALQHRFPDNAEVPLQRLRFQSGGLGKGSLWNPWGNVSYGNCLRFDICRSGLRVAIWRIFGPFSRPFMVPWNKIAVDEKRFLLWRFYRLSFGASDLSALTIPRRSFVRIGASGLLKHP